MDSPDGGATVDERAIVPGIGFTDLFLLDDTGQNYSHYLLVDITTAGGSCAEH